MNKVTVEGENIVCACGFNNLGTNKRCRNCGRKFGKRIKELLTDGKSQSRRR